MADPTSSSAARRQPGGRHLDLRAALRRFRSRLIVTIAVLAVVCAALGLVAILQGPKLQAWQVDAGAAASAPGQQVLLTFNEAVAPIRAAQVTMSPNVKTSIQTAGSGATLRLDTALKYATSYHLELHGVRSQKGGAASDLKLTIRTPPFSFLYLDRGTTDRIMSTTITGRPKTLYATAGIQWFTRVSKGLVVATTTPDQHTALAVIRPGLADEKLALPATGYVEGLTAIRDHVLFTFTGDPDATPVYDHTLFDLDTDGRTAAQPVAGIGGQPLAVETWVPVPGTTSVIMLCLDGSAYRYDPFAATPLTPLGAFVDLGGLSPDGTRLGVTDAIGPLSLALTTGKRTRISSPPVDGRPSFPDSATPLTATSNLLRLTVLSDKPGALPVSELVRGSTDASAVVTLFRPSGDAPLIIRYRLTANSQYAVVESIPDQLTYDPDDSPVNFQPQAISIQVVDVATGRRVLQVPGFDPLWP